jgi:hypothetical protein
MHFTGYRFVVILDVLLQIVIYVAIRFTVYNYAGFLFLVFLDNVCIGGILGTAPAFLQLVFGIKLGSHVYGFFWTVFSTANLLQYVYVSQLSQLITFDGIIYVCLGMCIVSGTLVITGNFEGYWKNSQEFLGYFRTCKKKTDQK